MAPRMIVQQIHRLTLVRKGKATAKHPDTRSGVVEKVAAIPGTATKFGAVYPPPPAPTLVDLARQYQAQEAAKKSPPPKQETYEECLQRLLHAGGDLPLVPRSSRPWQWG